MIGTCSFEMETGSWMPFMEVLSRCMNRQKLLQSRLKLTVSGLTSCQMVSKDTEQPDLVCSGCAALAVMPPLSAKPCCSQRGDLNMCKCTRRALAML